MSAAEHFPFPESESPEPEQIQSPYAKNTARRSEKIGELVAALAKAQLAFKAVVKDAENPAYTRGTKKSMYATLDSVISATRNPLAVNGLVIIALPQEMIDDKRLKITSILFHTSEQFIESTLVMTAVERVTPQELGKLITYARRYQWTSLSGVAPEDDTDGNESSGVGGKEAAQAIGARKVEELKANACLFYSWSDEKQEGYITGDKDLLTANKELLLYKGKLSADKKYIVVDAQGLEDLKFEFEQRKVNLRPLKGK